MDISAVIEQLRAVGLRLTNTVIEFGKFTRVPVDEPRPDRGTKKSGWYVVYEIRLDSGEYAFVGAFGNHKYGDDIHRLSLKPKGLSDADRLQYEQQMKAARKLRDEEQKAMAAQAATRAKKIWEKLPDSGQSQYLARKGVKPYGLRFARGSVVVPVRRADGQLVGLQWIDSTGQKRFLTGTPKRGAFHLIGELEPGGQVAICEGYATAATVHEALGIPVAVAFDCGNLKPVAQVIARTFSPALIIVAGDNDHQTKGNPGRTQALEAAQAVGGVSVVPAFEELPADAQ